ncbi:MAG: hypothetical protein M3X11_06975 [Acidobacteriota bacterium]|nr:hypothetical protein [Acidobacteriota bacterium]
MKKEQALKLAERVSELTGIAVPIIVGSQSLYALTDDVPEAVKQSVECDFLLAAASTEGFRRVITEIGFASDFQAQTGFYADALGLATVVLPTGWQDRLLPLDNADGKLCAYCLEVHDACVSKLMAGREKDFAFILGLLERQLILLDTLIERATLVIDMPQRDALLPRLEKLEQHLRISYLSPGLQSLRKLIGRLRSED